MQTDFEDELRICQQTVAAVSRKTAYREFDDEGKLAELVSRPGLPSNQLDHKIREEERNRPSKK